jgi:glycosyltransferase involved in cell wall biosynthesis
MIVNRLLLRTSDRLFGCGESVRQALISNEGLPASRVGVIRNGVDLAALAQPSPQARSRIRAEFGCRSDDFVVVQVARLHELKDHQTALRTMDRVRHHLPAARLLLVGEGDQEQAIRRTIAERSLAAQVTLAGNRTDVPDLLAAADVFLMTSISEGIPLTLIEAMAARVPVVATSVGGIPEMIDDGISGCLAGPSDDRALADALIRLHRQPDLRIRLADEAARTAHSRFGLDSMLTAYRQVYRSILNGAPT